MTSHDSSTTTTASSTSIDDVHVATSDDAHTTNAASIAASTYINANLATIPSSSECTLIPIPIPHLTANSIHSNNHIQPNIENNATNAANSHEYLYPSAAASSSFATSSPNLSSTSAAVPMSTSLSLPPLTSASASITIPSSSVSSTSTTNANNLPPPVFLSQQIRSQSLGLPFIWNNNDNNYNKDDQSNYLANNLDQKFSSSFLSKNYSQEQNQPKIQHRILILGASGNTGMLLLNDLFTCNVPVFVRCGISNTQYQQSSQSLQQQYAQEIKQDHLQIVEIDFHQITTLVNAMKDIEAIALILPWRRNIVEMMQNVMNAIAQAHNVKFMVKISTVLAESDATVEIGRTHYQCDELLRSCQSIDWTIVKSMPMLNNILKFQAENIRDNHVFYTTSLKGSVAYCHGNDIADSLLAILFNHKRYAKREFCLSGKEAVDVESLCKALSRVGSKKIRPRLINEDQMRQKLASLGVAKEMAEDVIGIERLKAEGIYATLTDSIFKLTGHQPRSIESFLQTYKKELYAPFSLRQLLNYFA